MRLQPLVSDRPKPMALVRGRPLLDYLLLALKRYRVTDVVFLVGHRGEAIQEHYAGGEAWGLRFRYSWDEEPRGTGGALRSAAELLPRDCFLVMNGDSFFDVDLEELARYHRRRRSLATLALAEVEVPGRYGTVEIDERDRIVRFAEKAQATASGLINGGVYVFQREVIDLIPEGRPVSLEREVFPGLIGRALYGVRCPGYFVDIGVPEAYSALNADPSRLVAAVCPER